MPLELVAIDGMQIADDGGDFDSGVPGAVPVPTITPLDLLFAEVLLLRLGGFELEERTEELGALLMLMLALSLSVLTTSGGLVD